ncbi:MAG: type II toxin-antitoxin system VapC family toxin [Candidatus Micrarchaeota archaeon]
MFIDANIFITQVFERDEDSKIARFLKRIYTGEQKACTSPLVMDEVFYFFCNNKNEKTAEKVWKRILSMPNLSILPVDKKTASFFLEFSSQGLESRDALHAATMKAHGISTICSYDKAFDKIKSIKRQEPK